MKKILIFLLTMVFVMSSVLLVACNTNVSKIWLEDVPKTVVRNETIDYSAIKLMVAYDNDTQKTIKLTDKGVEYDPIDTSTVGVKTLNVRYSGQTTAASIEVVEGAIGDDDIVMVWSFDNTHGYDEYLLAIQEQINKETEFYDRDVLYTVGTANGYRLLPRVVADIYEGDDVREDVVLQQVDTSFKLYRLVSGSYAEVTNINDWVDKVEDNVYYFSQEAEGEVFKIEVTLGDNYVLYDESTQTTISQEFKVVSGYNVYNALGLSVLDNLNVISWADIKQTVLPWDNGKALREFSDVSQVIIHDNIRVTVDDLPSNYFWVKNEQAKWERGVSFADAQNRAPEDLRGYLEGSLKEVYLGEEWEGDARDGGQRALYVSDGIGISGNYLQLSYDSNFDANNPTGKGIYIVHDQNQPSDGSTLYPESHTSFVCFTHALNADEIDIVGTRTIENVYFVGETQKTENITTPAGLMMMTSDMADVRIINTIGTQWFCNATLDGVSTGSITIDKCKFYDSFSQMVFSWGINEINITNSEMKRAGGPILILQTITSGTPRDTVLNIDSTANLESWVTGSEMWFTINKLPSLVVAQLLNVASLTDNFANTHYRRVVSGDIFQVNLVAIVIPEPGDVFTNQDAIPGTINVDETSYAMADPVLNALFGISAVAANGATLTETTIAAGGALLDADTTAMLQQLQAGFETLSTQTAALKVAPIYKCGNAYGMLNAKKEVTSLSPVTGGAQQLYDGSATVAQQIAGMIAKLETVGDPYNNVASLKQLQAAWSALAGNLQTLGTLSVDKDAWSTSFTAGQLAVWVNPGGLDASHPNLLLKHFMILLGEDATVTA